MNSEQAVDIKQDLKPVIRPRLNLNLSKGDRVAIAVLFQNKPIILNNKYKIIRIRNDGSMVIRPDGVISKGKGN